MQDSILIKDIEMVLPEGIRTGDIYIKEGKIQEIDWHIEKSAELVIREKGLTLIPGCIDTHVHFREPGYEHKEDLITGSFAAAAGGVTTFFDMPNNNPSTTTREALVHKKALASKKSLINYNFYVGATDENLDDLNNFENIAGIKVFMGSSTGSLLLNKAHDQEYLFAKTKHLIAIHAEDEAIISKNKTDFQDNKDYSIHEKIRSVKAALSATKRVVSLANNFNKRVHILHLTSAEEVELISYEVQKGLITSEVCIQHLLLTAPNVYEELGALGQVNPPIRGKKHAKALISGLKNNVISSVVSDHAPHLLKEKLSPYGEAPSGMPGVETTLPLILTMVNNNLFSLEEVVNYLSTNPAKIFRIKNKGELKKGFDADMVLVDMHGIKKIQDEKLYTKCKWSAFNNWKVRGIPMMTFVNGNMVYREGEFFADTKGKEVLIG